MFRLFNNIQYPLFAPTDAPPDSAPPGGKEDMIDFLNTDDEADSEIIELDESKKKELPKEPDEESEEEPEEKEDDELKEIEEELEEPSEEQLELMTPVRRREILAKYPKLFKDFPYLERAYYREQQFTELLPTIEDAREAVAKANTLDRFEVDLMQGDIGKVLHVLKQESPKGFAKLADNYLQSLADIDKDAYLHVLGNTIKHTIKAMVAEGRRSSNEALTQAALILNQFTFASSDFEEPTSLYKEEGDEKTNTEQNKLQRERQEFVRERFENSRDELNTRVNNTLRNTIDGHMDPKGSMSSYVKKQASREAMETLVDLLGRDARFRVLIDKHWERAISKNFDKSILDSIRSAYLSKAKTLLPAVIKKARNEALKGIGKRANADSEEESDDETRPKSAQNSTRKSASSETPERKRKITSAKDIPAGMSTLEFLSQD